MDDPQRKLKQWLAEKLRPHGAAVRLAKATGLSSDKITRSKELLSTDPKKRRTLQYEDIRAIAMHFGELPPGYEGMHQWLRDADATISNPTAAAVGAGTIRPRPILREHAKLTGRLGELFASILKADEDVQREAIEVLETLLPVRQRSRVTKTKEQS